MKSLLYGISRQRRVGNRQPPQPHPPMSLMIVCVCVRVCAYVSVLVECDVDEQLLEGIFFVFCRSDQMRYLVDPVWCRVLNYFAINLALYSSDFSLP